VKAASIVRRCGERLVPRLYSTEPDAVREAQEMEVMLRRAFASADTPCMAGTETLQPSLPFEAGSPRYEFVRHPRARRYVIRVVGDGTVRVTVPRWGSKREAEAFAVRERAWIEKQQRRVEAEREAT